MNYQQLLDKLNAYSHALSIMYFDVQTIAPKEGSAYRNKMMSILESDYYTLLTSDTTKQILLDNENSTDEIIKESVRILLQDFRRIENIPHDEYTAYNNLKRESFLAWEKARGNNDFSSYESTLSELFETHKKMIAYRNDGKPVYESCLDDYEEGLKQAQVDAFFKVIADRLVPFLDTILDSQGPKPAFLNAYVSVDTQKEISKLIMDHLGYSDDFGYLGETAHPFSSTMSIGDTRITTHYYEHDFVSSMFSIIHEIGHSMYNHQVDPKYEETPILHSMSSSLHESQSRLLENMIGRSKEFWIPIYPKLVEIIPDVLKDISLDDFILGINYVEKGQIRVDADEVTYPLHILVRTEFENIVASQDTSKLSLNTIYNDIFKKHLGYKPTSDSNGILQDVHWSEALIGYFPTYALGTAYGAQFMHQMRKDINVDELLMQGDLKAIFAWLKENIHQYGGAIETQTLIEKVTGETFNPNYYVDYLIDKYSKLLNI